MNRRQLLALTLVAAAPRLAFGDVEHVPYSREAYERALASGEPFLLDFYAPW